MESDNLYVKPKDRVARTGLIPLDSYVVAVCMEVPSRLMPEDDPEGTCYWHFNKDLNMRAREVNIEITNLIGRPDIYIAMHNAMHWLDDPTGITPVGYDVVTYEFTSFEEGKQYTWEVIALQPSSTTKNEPGPLSSQELGLCSQAYYESVSSPSGSLASSWDYLRSLVFSGQPSSCTES